MSKTFEIRINNGAVINKATRDISKYSKETQGKIRKAIEKGTIAVKNAARMKAPMGPTGNLKAGIVSKMTPNAAQGVVQSKARHSHLVEFGTEERIAYLKPQNKKKAMRFIKGNKAIFLGKEVHTGKMPKKPFMTPAAMQERGKIEKEMEKILK